MNGPVPNVWDDQKLEAVIKSFCADLRAFITGFVKDFPEQTPPMSLFEIVVSYDCILSQESRFTVHLKPSKKSGIVDEH